MRFPCTDERNYKFTYLNVNPWTITKTCGRFPFRLSGRMFFARKRSDRMLVTKALSQDMMILVPLSLIPKESPSLSLQSTYLHSIRFNKSHPTFDDKSNPHYFVILYLSHQQISHTHSVQHQMAVNHPFFHQDQ
jgi:hypothetical protein